MNEHLQIKTKTTLSRIEVLSEVMRLNSLGWSLSQVENQIEVEQALRTTWLPIFKNKANLSLALEAIISTCEDEKTSCLCSFFLSVLGGLNEDK
jgi:hypothetical protein